jgi:hypothetical protein
MAAGAILPPRMPAEAPFFFVVATLSASIAGLAGLVAALRRGSVLAPLELFRLRQIVEFAFATVLFSLATIPLIALLGLEPAIRVNGALLTTFFYVHGLLLVRRARIDHIRRSRGWVAVVIGLVMALIALGIVTVVSGSVAVYQLLLMVALARPMAAFLLVLATFETAGRPASDPQPGDLQADPVPDPAPDPAPAGTAPVAPELPSR